MKRLFVILSVFVLSVLTLFGAVMLKEGMWWEYRPNNSYIIYQAPDFIVKADHLKIVVLGKMEILKKPFYVAAHIYSGNWGKFVRVGLVDPESFFMAPNVTFARLIASGKIDIVELKFPLLVGKEWEVTKGVKARVVGKEKVNVRGRSLSGWVVEYSGDVSGKVLFCEEIGANIWVRSNYNDFVLQDYGESDLQKLISEVKDALLDMINIAPYSALSAVEVLESFNLTKELAEKIREEIMKSLQSSSLWIRTNGISPLLVADSSDCMVECAQGCYTYYIMCTMGCVISGSYFDPYCARKCKEKHELCKRQCCEFCGTPCITSPPSEPSLEETY